MNFNLGNDSTRDQGGKHNKDKPSTHKRHVRIADEENDYEDEQVFVRGPAKVVVLEDDTSVANQQSAAEMNPQEEVATQHTKLAQPEPSPRQKQLLIPRSHMTKGEKRRLQLELESEAIEKLQKDTQARNEKLGLPSNRDKPSERLNDTKANKSIKDGSVTKVAAAQPVGKGKGSTVNRGAMREAVVFVEPDFVPGLGDLSTTETNAHRVTTDNTNTASKYESHVQQPQPPHKEIVQQPQILSKAEQKRLQWEREKGKKSLSVTSLSMLTNLAQ